MADKHLINEACELAHQGRFAQAGLLYLKGGDTESARAMADLAEHGRLALPAIYRDGDGRMYAAHVHD